MVIALAVISGLLGVSEALAGLPSVPANSVWQLGVFALSALKGFLKGKVAK